MTVGAEGNSTVDVVIWRGGERRELTRVEVGGGSGGGETIAS